ncbi:MAG: hypothetical protein WB682_04600, partial [Candidatus Dormiibacterota bacterium]
IKAGRRRLGAPVRLAERTWSRMAMGRYPETVTREADQPVRPGSPGPTHSYRAGQHCWKCKFSFRALTRRRVLHA